MARFPRFRFLALAVIFHLIYIYSIFDIYFVSPVVSGMRLFSVDRPAPSKPPADRLVLFVGMLLVISLQSPLHCVQPRLTRLSNQVTVCVPTRPCSRIPSPTPSPTQTSSHGPWRLS